MYHLATIVYTSINWTGRSGRLIFKQLGREFLEWTPSGQMDAKRPTHFIPAGQPGDGLGKYYCCGRSLREMDAAALLHFPFYHFPFDPLTLVVLLKRSVD